MERKNEKPNTKLLKKMLIPRTGTEVTGEWLKMVIENHEKILHPGFSFSVKEFIIEAGANPGENYNSDLVKVEVIGIASNENTEEPEEKTYYLMLKFHSLDVFSKEINKLSHNHIREMSLYSEIHKTLSSFQEKEYQGKYKLNIPELFYTYNEREVFVLAMQNMKPMGYVINDKRKGLSFEHLKLAVTQIARWHALSYVYNKKSNFIKQYPYIVNSRKFEFVLRLIASILTNIYPLVSEREEYTDFYKRLQNKKKIKENLQSILLPKDQGNSQSIFCLSHGDFWNNNLLFAYNNTSEGEEEIPTDISIVDWQMIEWNSPLIDLHYLLHTSTTYAVRKQHTDAFLRIYYSIFDEILKASELSIPNWTYDTFRKEFDDASMVGFVFGCILSQGTLSKAGEKISRQRTAVVDVQSVAYNLKSKIAKTIMPLFQTQSMSFLIQAMFKKMFDPIRKEIKDGTNEVLNDRLMGLIDEAIERGTLDGIPPV